MTARARSVAESAALALGLIGLLGLGYALLAREALDGFPYSGDEYSLALQGELFARGQVRAPAPPHAEWLGVDHVVIDRWVRSKYPPGAPALLGLGSRAGAAWLVTPLEAVIALAAVWHTSRRLLGPRPALAALLALGLAPLYGYNAASFYPHAASTMFLALAFAAVASWTLGRRTGWLVLAGAAIGCAFLTRPTDAIAFGAAMAVFRSPRAVIVAAAAALPFVALNLAYQGAAFGSPFTDGYHAYEATFAAIYGAQTAAHALSLAHLVSPLQWWNHLDIYRAIALEWTVPGTVIAAAFGARAVAAGHPARPMRTFALALIAVLAVSLLPMISDIDDGARPRYLSVALVPLALLAGAGFGPTCEAIVGGFGRRPRTIAVAAAVVLAVAQLGSIMQERVPRVQRREGLYQAVASGHLGRAVVVVRARYPSRFARNGPFFDRSVLYLSAPPSVGAEVVAAAYPDREVWEAHEGDPWSLVRVR